MLKKLLLLLPMLAATTSSGNAADELDGLDQTMQVLDDAGALQRTLSAMPAPRELQGGPLPPARAEPESQLSFDSGVVIEEDELLTEDDFEEGEDIDDDRYDDV